MGDAATYSEAGLDGEEVQGIIVRRNCMGKKLSFMDVRVDEDSASTVENATPEDGHIDTKAKIVKVAFRRHLSSAWSVDEAVQQRPFPIKTSDLPYGALVWMRLGPQPSPVQVNEVNDKTDSNTNDNSKNKKNTFPREVIAWKVLKDPRQDAETLASVGQNHGGMLYTTYLRERGNSFWATTKGQHLASNSDRPQHLMAKKRARTTGTLPSLEKTTENANSTATVDMNTNTTERNNQNDDLQQGGHGDKVAKTMRARIFAQWLLDTYGASSLQQGSGVLDVAGGKGNLSIELATMGQVPCTVIDPMIRKQQQSFPPKRDTKRIRKAGGPLPRHLPTFFNLTTFLEQFGAPAKKELASSDSSMAQQGKNSNTLNTEKCNTIDSKDDQEGDDRCLVADSSMLVGLHPDQVTQDILELALQFDKNVAIVPCCVFPSFFPLRVLQNGKPVVTHSQFCQYLMELDPSLKQAELPFQGRNIVIYRCKKSSMKS